MHTYLFLILILLPFQFPVTFQFEPDSCSALSDKHEDYYCSSSGKLRNLLYTVSAGEGFNLRRDVYMRMAHVVAGLRQNGHNVTLVLPVWGPLPHWPHDERDLPWNMFFDVASLNRLIPVMEFRDFVSDASHVTDIYLSHFPETFSSDNRWHERYQFKECPKVYKPSAVCMMFAGTTSTLIQVIENHFSDHPSVRIVNAEVVLHQDYGSAFFWTIRRSMRFSNDLIRIANEFRSHYLDSDDVKDRTEMPDDWREVIHKAGDAIGGHYLSLHWRRADFATFRSGNVPSIECTADQIKRISKNHNMSRLFLATDASASEIDQLMKHLNNKSKIQVFMFGKNESVVSQHVSLSSGQKAIIDQWICSHSCLFVGR